MIGRKIYYYTEIASTQEEAKKLALTGVGEGTVVLAESQTKGKGKLGRSWASPKGGVYLSIILKPYANLSGFSEITLLGSLTIARAIRGLYSLEAKLKWPNDVLIHGKKVAGVLTEVGPKNSLIVGIGLNANNDLSSFPLDLKKDSTSLKNELGKEIDNQKIVQVLLEEFEKLYSILLKEGSEKILSEWKTLSETLDSWVKVFLSNKEYEGKVIGLGQHGELILKELGGNIQRFTAGDVIKVRRV